MRITGLSASSYETYSWCQWKYYLQTSLGFEDVSGPSAVLGHIAHKVLELFSKASMVNHPKDSKIWDANYVWDICFNHYYKVENKGAEGIKNDKIKAVCRGIKELLNSSYTPIRHNTIATEVKANVPLVGKDFKLKDSDKTFYIRGYIDRIDKIDDKTVEIVDYKSGTRTDYESKDRHKKTSEDIFKSIQAKLYHYATKQLYPWAENILVTFIYITDGGPVTAFFCDDDLKDTIELVKKRFKAVQANEDPQRTRSWKCNALCPFGKDGTCDFVWSEKEDLGLNFLVEKYKVLNERKKILR